MISAELDATLSSFPLDERLTDELVYWLPPIPGYHSSLVWYSRELLPFLLASSYPDSV